MSAMHIPLDKRAAAILSRAFADSVARRKAMPHLTEAQHVALDNGPWLHSESIEVARRYIPGRTPQAKYRKTLYALAQECRAEWNKGQPWRGNPVPEL